MLNNLNCRGFGPLLEDKLCLIFKLAPSVCRMTFPILASLLVRLVVLLPFQLLRLSLATPSRWTPLALSKIGRASCRERVESAVGGRVLREKRMTERVSAHGVGEDALGA